jgi:hypothetical protein
MTFPLLVLSETGNVYLGSSDTFWEVPAKQV